MISGLVEQEERSQMKYDAVQHKFEYEPFEINIFIELTSNILEIESPIEEKLRKVSVRSSLSTFILLDELFDAILSKYMDEKEEKELKKYLDKKPFLKLYLHYLITSIKDFLINKGKIELVSKIRIKLYRDLEIDNWSVLYLLVQFKKTADIGLVNELWREYMDNLDSPFIKTMRKIDEKIINNVFIVFRVGGE